MGRFDVLDVTQRTSVVYAQLSQALKDAGGPILANDSWIAALALRHKLPVLSHDAHFDAVPGLDRRSW